MPQQPIALVIFACDTGDVEKLALNAAVGAVQARALIRLRRLPDVDTLKTSDVLTRMRKEYVPPTEADILAANALILASGPASDPASPPWSDFLPLLARLREAGQLRGKTGATMGNLTPVMTDLGFTMIPETPDDPFAVGRAVASLARSVLGRSS